MTSSEVYVEHTVDVELRSARWHCYTTANDGRSRQRIGCAHLLPRDATRHAEALSKRRRGSTPEEGEFDDV